MRRYRNDAEGGEQVVQEVWSWAELAPSATPVLPCWWSSTRCTGMKLPVTPPTASPSWFWGVFGTLRRYDGDWRGGGGADPPAGPGGIDVFHERRTTTSSFRMAPCPPCGCWPLACWSAGLLELGSRTLRAYVVDEAGKRADLLLSAAIFRKTLDLQPKDRPQSSGQYARPGARASTRCASSSAPPPWWA